MLNKEKYMDELMKYACEGSRFAVLKYSGDFEKCANVACMMCIFGGNSDCCSKARMKWLEQEYEPSVDWTKVPIDTPILVRDHVCLRWIKRYFARYENGKVCAWASGATSWSVDNGMYYEYEYAKLAESEE